MQSRHQKLRRRILLYSELCLRAGMHSTSTSTCKLSLKHSAQLFLAESTRIQANDCDAHSIVHCRYNKQVLKVFPYPITCTTIQVSSKPSGLGSPSQKSCLRVTVLVLQFAVGSLVSLLLWGTGLLKKPEIKSEMVHLLILHRHMLTQFMLVLLTECLIT